MTRNEKIGGIIVVLFLAGIFGFIITKESPSPTLGFTSQTQAAYVVTSTATQVTTTLYAFSGVLHTLSVTKPVQGSVITIFDSATTTAPTIAPIIITIPANATSTPFTLTFDGIFNNGLTVQQSNATSTLTVTYQQP